MTVHTPYHLRQGGFTLVEVIVTLLLGGILGTMLVQLGGTALVKSGTAVINVMDEAAGQRLMEEVIADYTSRINTAPDNALAYIMGKTYGTGNQVQKQYVSFDSDGKISFLPPGTPGNTLRVTVSSGGHTLTTLLAKTRTAALDPKEKY